MQILYSERLRSFQLHLSGLFPEPRHKLAFKVTLQLAGRLFNT